MKRKNWQIIVFLLLSLATLLLSSNSLLAESHYNYDIPECENCHGVNGHTNEYYMPHRFFGEVTYQGADGTTYTFNSDKCRLCHDVHEASTDFRLLPANTISGVCETCHDQTGAWGLYGIISHYGDTPQGEHTVDVTSTVPGGNSLSDVLKCNSCHTVHGNTEMRDFISEDQARHWYATSTFTNKLLRDDVGGNPEGTFQNYGSLWCAACHDFRVTTGTHINHPVDTSTPYQLFGVTSTYYSQYPAISRDNEWCGLCHADIISPPSSLPEGTNATFTFYPVPANPDGRVEPRPQAPLCQHCHEDSRDVEIAWNGNPWPRTSFGATTETFPTSQLPSSSLPPNPKYFVFPHQTLNPNLLVETGDDLCLNCHLVSSLP